MESLYPMPWYGAGFSGGGISAPEEVPLTVNGDGNPVKIEKPKSRRQASYSPSSPFYPGGGAGGWGGEMGIDGLGGYGSFGWPSQVGADGVPESNATNPLDALRKATGRIASTYYNFRRMRADGIVAIGREIADALISTNQWSYEARDEDVDADYVKVIQDMWEGRGSTGESHEGWCLREFFLSESCRARDFGNHSLELVWGEDDNGKLVVDEFLSLLPENTRPLVYQGTRKFAGLKNWGIGSAIELDPEYCVRFVYDAEGGDLYGRSRFENCKDWIKLKWDIRDKIRTDLNISIGNIMQVEYPTGRTTDETTTNETKAKTIAISLARGLSVTVPGFSIENQLALARNNIDPTKLRAWKIDRLDTGTNSFDGFKTAIDLVNEEILFGLLVLPRAVREADHGSKADAEQHTDSQAMMSWRWITYVVGIAQNITDRICQQRWGEKGLVKIKPSPINDETRALLKGIYTQLLSDKAMAVKVLQIKSDLEKMGIKVKPEFDQEQMDAELSSGDLSDALSTRERMRKGGYKDPQIDKIQQEKASEDAVPTDADGLGGGGGSR